jgi:WD40 repeat protein
MIDPVEHWVGSCHVRTMTNRFTCVLLIICGCACRNTPREPASPPQSSATPDATSTHAPEPSPASSAIARLGSTKFRHGDSVDDLAFSPDGTTVTTLAWGRPKSVRTWNVSTGAELRVFDETYNGIAIAPDGRTMLLSRWMGTIEIVDTSTGRQTKALRTGPAIDCIALSPDGKLVATWSIDQQRKLDAPTGGVNVVEVFDLQTGTRVHRLERMQDQRVVGDISRRQSSTHTMVRFLSFTADGSGVVSGSWDKTVAIWNLRSGELTRTFGGLTTPASVFALSVTGEIAVAGDDARLRRFDLRSGKALGVLELGQRARKMTYSPNGELLAIFDGDRLSVWNLREGKTAASWAATKRGGAVAFSPDGSALATTEDGAVRFWNPNTGEELRPDDGHHGFVTALAFSPDDTLLASQGNSNETIRIWETNTGRLRGVVPIFGNSLSNPLAFSPDGGLLAGVRIDPPSVVVFDVTSGATVAQLRREEDERAIGDLRFSTDGATLFTVEQQRGALRTWNIPTRTLVRDVRVGFGEGQNQLVRFSRDGRFVVVAKSVNRAPSPPPYHLGIWNTETGEQTRALELGEAGMPRVAAFSPNNQQLYLGTYAGDVLSFDIVNNRVLTYFRHGNRKQADGILHIALSNNGKVLTTTTSWRSDNIIDVWNTTTGANIAEYPAHGFQLYSLAVSSTGDRVASGGADSVISLWPGPKSE